jgi:hypothetical protein
MLQIFFTCSKVFSALARYINSIFTHSSLTHWWFQVLLEGTKSSYDDRCSEGWLSSGNILSRFVSFLEETTS